MNSLNYDILIVADQPSQANDLVAMLGSLAQINLNSHFVRDNTRFKAALKLQKWDLVLGDFVQAELDPAEATRLIKKHQPGVPLLDISENPAKKIKGCEVQTLVEKDDLPQLASLVKQMLEEQHTPPETFQPDTSSTGSDELYRNIIDLQTELICRYDQNFYLTYVNPAYCKWAGHTAEELVGSCLLDRIPQEDQEHAIRHVRSLSPEYPSATSNHRSVMPDGTNNLIEWTDRALLDAAGKVIGYQGVGRDVANHIQRSAQLLALKTEAEEQRDNLFSVLNTMQDAIHSLTLPDRKLIFASASIEDIYGYPVEKIVEPSLFLEHIVHPDDLELVLGSMETCLRDGFVELDHRVVWPDGQVRWLQRRAWVNYNEMGWPIRVNDTARDITERKNAEEILRATEQRYRQMFEFHGLPKLIVDPVNGKIVEANPAAGEFYGYDLSTLKNLNVTDINVGSIDELIAVKEKASANRMISFRFVHRLADGATRDVEVFSGPIEHDGQQMLYSTVTDITEKERAKAALEEANNLLEQRVAERTAELENVNNRLEAIFNHSGDGILMLDVDKGIQEANSTFSQLFDVLPEDYLGNSLGAFVHSQELSSIEATVQEVAATHQKREVEVRAKRPDGSSFDVEISLAPINRSDEAVTSLVCIIRDITERKLAESVLQNYTAEVHDLYNNAPTGYHSLDCEGYFVQINDTTLGWLGYSREEVVGKLRFLDVITPSSKPLFLENYPIFKQRGWVKDLEFEMQRKDGSTFPVMLNATAIRDEKGNYLYSRSTMFDVTDLKKAQQAIAEERNLLRTVIDTVPDFIYVKDTNHRLILDNRSHAHSLKANDPAEMVGKDDFDLFPAEMAGKFRADETRLFETGTPVLNTEERSIGEDGSEIWGLTTKVPLRNLNGELTGLVGITRDISELKISEEALNQKRLEELQVQNYLKALHSITIKLARTESLDEFYRCVVEQGRESFGFERIGLFLFDSKDGSATGTYGTDIYGQMTDERNLRIEGDNLPDIFIRALQGNERFAFIEEAPLFQELKQITTGQNAVAMMWHGVAQGWLCVDNGINFKPITSAQLEILALYALTAGSLLARKQAELSLKESEEKFRLLIESAPISTLITDKNGKIVLANREAENLFGYTQTELVGHSIDLLVPEEFRPNHPNHRRDFLKKGVARPHGLVELTARRKDGEAFPADIQLSSINTQAGPLVMSFVLDITKRKQTEEALLEALAQEKELGDLKSRFVSTASHEFRTPLASILATTETLKAYREKMDKTQIDNRLDKIGKQVLHMKDIMEDVLQLARIQAGRVEFKPAPGDLTALCLEIVEEFESQPVNRGRILFHCDTAPLVQEYDPHLMRGVINNLISNALKYSPPENSIVIDLYRENGEVRLNVTDKGIGIPSEDLKRLFEPFHRASNVGTIAGTGLGLSIAKQSVELHGGTLTAVSQVNQGTTMKLALPLEIPDVRAQRLTGALKKFTGELAAKPLSKTG